MSPEEAKLLLEAWNFFDSHPGQKYWEGLPGITRDEFYRLMPIITGIENLVEAKIYLGKVAQGQIAETVPGTIIEKAKEGEIPKPHIEDARRATAAVRSWLRNIKPKGQEDLAAREVARAQLKAELTRIEETRAKAPEVKVTPKPPVLVETPSLAAEESIVIKITPAALKSFQESAGKAAGIPFKLVAFFSPPKGFAETPTTSAALASAMTLSQISAKAEGLSGTEKKHLLELIENFRRAEFSFYSQVKLQRTNISVREMIILLGPEFGRTQGEIVTLVRGAPEKGPSFLGGIGQQIFGGLTQRAVTKAAAKAVTSALSKAGISVTTKVAAAAAGTAVAPGVGTVVGLVVDWLVGKLIKPLIDKVLDFIRENKWVLAAPFVLAGIVFSLPWLTVGGIVLGGVLYAGGVRSALVSAGGVVSGLIGGLATLTVASIATPLLIALISIPVLVAIILFIINSGAYIVPPKIAISGTIESPYIDVKKTATPDCLNRTEPGKTCGRLPGSVTYEIEIRAKKGTLTNIEIDNSYEVFGKGTKDFEEPVIEAPSHISPVEPFKFSYTILFDNKQNDSVIYDTLTVKADAPEQKGAIASDVASVIIGQPPASSCPILGGSITTGSYSGRVEMGHGSNPYWSGPAGSDCSYDIPAFSDCYSPTSSADPDENNICRGRPQACAYYGYAADVGGAGGTPVFLPSIFGESLEWEFVRKVTIAKTAWGWGYLFKSHGYQLYLGHLNNTTPPQIAPSGTAIGSLFPGLSPPHVHIELQINGRWVRPDFLCGGPGP